VKKPMQLDVKDFNPHASSNHACSDMVIYRKHELSKHMKLELNIYSSSLIFSATGGMAAKATAFNRRLYNLISDMLDTNCAVIMRSV